MASTGFSRFKWGLIIEGILTVLIAMSGCATLDKNECLNADWRTIGYEDGTRGYSGSQIGNHRKACAKYDVAPDLDQYEEGRLMGLREYCTPRNGYHLGTLGKGYNGVCPVDLEPGFRHALQVGKKIYAMEKEIQQQRNELKKAYEALDAINIELSDKEAELIRSNVSPHRRKQLLDELRTLEDEQKTHSAEIVEMEKTLEWLQRDLSLAREQSPYK